MKTMKVKPRRLNADVISKFAVCIFWSKDDDAYIAVAPELKGCTACGLTYQKALKEILTVIPVWIESAEDEGWTVPRPRGERAFSIL